MLSETRYEHIILDEARVPLIAGTRVKVIELVLDHLAYGWSPEELHFQHPHLTMGQIHSALAYYWDHRDEIERGMAADAAFEEECRRLYPSALQEKLRQRASE